MEEEDEKDEAALPWSHGCSFELLFFVALPGLVIPTLPFRKVPGWDRRPAQGSQVPLT